MTEPAREAQDAGTVPLLSVDAVPANLARIRQFVRARAILLGAGPEAAADLVQAVDESATNIIEHGYRGAAGIVEVEMQALAGAIEVRLRDHAPPFDPTRVPRPDLDLPLERRPLGGMGVHLTRDMTDEATYGSPEGWSNELILVKRIEPTGAGG